MAQDKLMKFDPATGQERPYPSHAAQWRDYHGALTAWLFNPWDGMRRDAHAVGSDTFGFAIVDAKYAAPPKAAPLDAPLPVPKKAQRPPWESTLPAPSFDSLARE